jgi:hypothetical protein
MKREKWLTGCKVLTLRNNKLSSYWTDIAIPFFYSTHFTTTRRMCFGALAVYGTLDDALNHVAGMPGEYRFYRCKYTPSMSRELYSPEDGSPFFHIPPCTIYADKIRLTRRVK